MHSLHVGIGRETQETRWMVLPRHQSKGGAPKISALERAKLLLRRKGVGNLPALAPDQTMVFL